MPILRAYEARKRLEAGMSSYGAPDCPICGAASDYCTLETASGITIDCRNLELRDPTDLEWNIKLAADLRSMLRNTKHATEGNP